MAVAFLLRSVGAGLASRALVGFFPHGYSTKEKTMTTRAARSVLGLRPGASVEEARAARNRLMKMYHPDRNQDDPEATRRAQEINGAFRVLRSVRRAPGFVRRSTQHQRTRAWQPASRARR